VNVVLCVMGILLSLLAIYLAVANVKSKSRYFRIHPEYSELTRQEKKILKNLYQRCDRNFEVPQDDFDEVVSTYTTGDTFAKDTARKLSSSGWIDNDDGHKRIPNDIGKFLRDLHDDRIYAKLMW